LIDVSQHKTIGSAFVCLAHETCQSVTSLNELYFSSTAGIKQDFVGLLFEALGAKCMGHKSVQHDSSSGSSGMLINRLGIVCMQIFHS